MTAMLFWRTLREGRGSGPVPPWQSESFDDDGIAVDAARTPDTTDSRVVYLMRVMGHAETQRAWVWRAGEAFRLPPAHWQPLTGWDACTEWMPRGKCWPAAWESTPNGLLMMANLQHISNAACLRAAIRCVRWVIEAARMELHPIVEARLTYLDGYCGGRRAPEPDENRVPDGRDSAMHIRRLHLATYNLAALRYRSIGGSWSGHCYQSMSEALRALDTSEITRQDGLAKFAEILRDEIGDDVYTKLAQPNRRPDATR